VGDGRDVCHTRVWAWRASHHHWTVGGVGSESAVCDGQGDAFMRGSAISGRRWLPMSGMGQLVSVGVVRAHGMS